jgi:hypothetical protein
MKKTSFLVVLVMLLSLSTKAQYTGFTPWENCFGKNVSCNNYGCSAIEVNTSSSSPIVAIVKKYGKVVKHAYISASSSYTFQLKDGTYQVFFYHGNLWDRNKKMNSDECNSLYGGFSSGEAVTKDNPIKLSNQVMTYTLIPTTNGNFNTKSSSLSEAL